MNRDVFLSKDNYSVLSQIIEEQLKVEKEEDLAVLRSKIFTKMIGVFDQHTDMTVNEMNKMCIVIEHGRLVQIFIHF
jgi:phosphorylcholine metabolism protein LicD